MAAPADPRVVKLIHPSAHKKTAQAPAPAPKVAAAATPAPPKPRKRKKGERVDWAGLEPHYRANSLTLTVIAEMFGISAPAIVQHAKRQKPPWTRDASGLIDARVDELVNEAAVKAVNPAVNSDADVNGKPRVVTQAVIVQATAQVIANVRLGQRGRFTQMAELSTAMFMELKEAFANRTDLRTLGELLAQYTDGGAPTPLTKAFMEAVSLPGQIKAFKDLTDIIAKLTEMESKAYKLDKAPEEGAGGRANLPIRFVGTQYVERVEPEEDD